ncbi:phage tail protein [Enterobacter mori]|uniref:phage tail protein n=1 Tax=Enterobacter mori TaxID=539813 RepID=UPI002E788BDC|nr:phage tail protein [Enterobacter mori]
MRLLWSPKNNAGIPEAMLKQYQDKNWDVSDCVSVSAEVESEFIGVAPVNKVRVTGRDGMPTWADIDLQIDGHYRDGTQI